ncbi:hypothetical protein [Agrococcus sp. HG114]|uniref:hypothetical protein n=1 Tax=Agrococcus sp. HG114 TaxID=2969757 RepID=UPI00215B49D9|nr:hypothetical protein [Agrococcus sp. HG114]MCR8670701.1 hypothetical protein [Agrococcus sp. HG114]
MNRRWVAGAAAAALGTLMVAGGGAAATAAPVGFPVHVVVHTDFTSEVSEFESTIPGCETGTVVEGTSRTHFTWWGGVYVGIKEFTCDSGEGGFDVRLNARFGEFGSTGTWSVADAWGEFEGVHANGTLVGVPVSDTMIDDIYTGTAR